MGIVMQLLIKGCKFPNNNSPESRWRGREPTRYFSIASSLLCQWGGDYSSQSRADYFDEGKSLQPLIPLLLKLPCVTECLCRCPHRRVTVWFETTVNRWGFAQIPCSVRNWIAVKQSNLNQKTEYKK